MGPAVKKEERRKIFAIISIQLKATIDICGKTSGIVIS